MERILVTGCGGFVGRYLTDLLVEEGFETWGADREPAANEFAGHECVPCDLRNRGDVDGLLDRVQPGYIVHLAAQSSGRISFSQPHQTLSNNILSILNILDWLRTSGSTTRLLAVGSADVYGSVQKKDLPLRETQPRNPNNPYALSKAIQEESCAMYAALYDVDVVSTRSFNHTGAGRPDTFVLSSFARRIIEIKSGVREPVVEVGNVDVRRDFSDVEDVCRAYLMLLRRGKSGEVYNVCSGESHTLRALLEKLAVLAGVQIEIRVDKERLRPSDMEELRGDYTKLTRDTGWAPRIPIERTLQSLLDFWLATIQSSNKRDIK